MSEALWFDPQTSAVRDENRLAVAHLAPGEPDETGFAMAAGPELLEALEAIVEEYAGISDTWKRRSLDAIAKARGKEPTP